MFGRLKLALVALVLMPAVAFAADQSPRHSPGPAPQPAAFEVKVAAGKAEPVAAVARKHRADVKASPASPSTIEAFLASLGGKPAASAGKQAEATADTATPRRPGAHVPG